MLVPFDWLKEYIDIDMPVRQVAEALTMVGLEVTDISYFQPELDNVVVGEILKIKKHSNADNLTVCQVSDGRQIFSVVCGAKNIKERDKIPLARVGATLAGGLKISKRKIREEVSSGMLCSEKELGIGEGHEGILILPRNSKLGEKVGKILLSNPVMDIELTANRSDCASVIGIAREVSAILRKPLKLPGVKLNEAETTAATLCSVEVKAPDRCRRYTARVVRNIKVGPSPGWLVKKLTQSGMRPVNNVVDITNWVLAEFGHPLHSFDYDKLNEHKIIVRRGNDGEKLRCLDGLEREIGTEDLVIADAGKPLALAGIIGGEETGVVESTRNVLLESAYFTSGGIRKTAARMNINTEASYRFERGVDVDNVITAINRAARLIQELCGGEIAGGSVDVYPEPFAGVELDFPLESVNRVIGSDVSNDDIMAILKSLGFGCEVKPDNPGRLKIKVPSFRNDVTGNIDIIEEIARIHGYNKIVSVMPGIQISSSSSAEVFGFEGRTREAMSKLGFFEVINYSLVGDEAFDNIKEECMEKVLKISNPLVSEQSLMRTSLLAGLLSTVRRNLNRKINDMKIYELGRVFTGNQEKGKLPVEKRMLGGCITGARQEKHWDETLKPVDFYYLKGIMESLFSSLGIRGYSFKPSGNPVFSAAESCDIIKNDSCLGSFGLIALRLEKKYDFILPVYAFELDLSGGHKLADSAGKYSEIPKYPAMKRDISLLSPKGLTYNRIYATIMKSGDTLIKDVRLFDMYTGKQVKEGYQGMAFRITYQSENRTLIDQEVNDLHQGIISTIEKDLKVIIRK